MQRKRGRGRAYGVLFAVVYWATDTGKKKEIETKSMLLLKAGDASYGENASVGDACLDVGRECEDRNEEW